jgi:WD40 repeat protein
MAGSNTIHLWSVGQLDRPQELVKPSAVAINGALAGNEQMLAISGGNTIDIWDIKSKTFVTRTASEGAIFGKLNFNRDGDKLLAIDAVANKLLVWPVVDKSAKQMSGYSAAVFSPDSKMIAAHTVEKPSITRLLDPGSGNTIRELNLSSGVGPLAFSPNGRVLASGFSDEKFVGVGFWDTTSGLLLGRVSGGKISIGQSAFRTDGTALATIESQEVKVWRTPRLVEIIVRGNSLTQVVPEVGPPPRVLREQAPPPRTVRQ